LGGPQYMVEGRNMWWEEKKRMELWSTGVMGKNWSVEKTD